MATRAKPIQTRVIGTILPLLLAAACDNLSGGKGIQPELTSRATHARVVMHAEWLPRDVLLARCNGKLACNERSPIFIDGDWHAYLEIPEPRDFNDFNTLETVGHECWHGFGATHK